VPPVIPPRGEPLLLVLLALLLVQLVKFPREALGSPLLVRGVKPGKLALMRQGKTVRVARAEQHKEARQEAQEREEKEGGKTRPLCVKRCLSNSQVARPVII
jgi:hypothetical protein